MTHPSSGAPRAEGAVTATSEGRNSPGEGPLQDATPSPGREVVGGPSTPTSPVEGKAAQPFVARRIEYAGTGMGTKIALVAYTSPQLPERSVRAAFDSALHKMQHLEQLLSDWRSDSDVGRINAQPGRFVSVSDQTRFVIEKGLWCGALSLGAFDVTYAALDPLWKFGDAADSTPTLPDPREVARAVARVDYRLVNVEPETGRVRIGPRQKLGLGGIAKGYIVDEMAAALSRAGLGAYLVQAGGDLYAAGTKPWGEAWEAGVQDPRLPIGNAFAKLALRDRAFSTAGDYARAFFVDGKRYHHIVDPATGRPSSASRSVTVWAPSALIADALDDAIFILGPEKGLSLVESQPGVGAVIVDGNNRLWVSQRLRTQLKVHHLPTDGP